MINKDSCNELIIGTICIIYNNMKKLSFLFAMLWLPMSCLAGVSCNTIGDTVYCSGHDSDGNYISTTTNKNGLYQWLYW